MPPMRRLPLPAVLTLCCLLLIATAAGAAPAKAKPKTAPKSSSKSAAKAPEPKLNADVLSGLKFRSIGPALTSGRIVDLAVAPDQPNTWYVAVASGGVWKTENAGTTWKPIFDSEKSYSIGCLAVDPKHPLTVWVGTGENNSQRSVGYGDGLYKSVDGGENWEHVGL